jgi:hypothetical protein
MVGNESEHERFKTALMRNVFALLALALCLCVVNAQYRTKNFVVQANSQQLAQIVGDNAEQFRKELTELWFDKTYPQWSKPCPIKITKYGNNIGGGGMTAMAFHNGHVFGWEMQIQGSPANLLSVLKHEVNHTVFATEFRQPLPRWIDEGACMSVESYQERTKSNKMLAEFLTTNRGIPFSSMFAMTEYPSDILPLYAQGYSLTEFLLQRGGKSRQLGLIDGNRKLAQYIRTGLNKGFVQALHEHYAYKGLGQLQKDWLDWVRKGSKPFVASATAVGTVQDNGSIKWSQPERQVVRQPGAT